MPINTVLFDYSGVLTSSLHLPTDNVPYDPDAVFVEMAAALSSSAAHPWHELERGEISLDVYLAYVESRVPGASALFALESELNVMASLSLRPERLDVARSLQNEGLRIGLVTNNVLEWQPHWLPRLPDGLFEIVIDSAQVGCRKPEPAIYELAMQEMDVDDPASVLFIDDFEWNVAGAIAMGMAGLHCEAHLDLGPAVADLRAT